MPKKPTNKQLRAAALRLHGEDGVCEIDPDAEVSHNEREAGAYVQAWVWVGFADVTDEDRNSK